MPPPSQLAKWACWAVLALAGANSAYGQASVDGNGTTLPPPLPGNAATSKFTPDANYEIVITASTCFRVTYPNGVKTLGAPYGAQWLPNGGTWRAKTTTPLSAGTYLIQWTYKYRTSTLGPNGLVKGPWVRDVIISSPDITF